MGRLVSLVGVGPTHILREVLDPDTLVDAGTIYGKDVATISELHWLDSNGKIVQITDDGVLNVPASSILPVVDTTSLVKDPADDTKQMRIDVGAVITGTVRTLTMPDEDIDLTPGAGTYVGRAGVLGGQSLLGSTITGTTETLTVRANAADAINTGTHVKFQSGIEFTGVVTIGFPNRYHLGLAGSNLSILWDTTSRLNISEAGSSHMRWDFAVALGGTTWAWNTTTVNRNVAFGSDFNTNFFHLDANNGFSGACLGINGVSTPKLNRVLDVFGQSRFRDYIIEGTGSTIAFGDTPYSVLDDDGVLLVDATGGNVVINLQALAGVTGRKITVKKVDSSANTVTIDASLAETIDGALTEVLTAQYQSRTFYAGPLEWNLI